MGRLAMLGALVYLLAGCYETPRAPCAFLCGEGGECPSGYTCGGDDRCHLLVNGEPAECEPLPGSTADAPLEPDAPESIPDAPVSEPDAPVVDEPDAAVPDEPDAPVPDEPDAPVPEFDAPAPEFDAQVFDATVFDA